MKGFGYLTLCVVVNICMANIDPNTTKNKLENAKSQEAAISKKLDVLGKAINTKNLELTQLGKQISSLEKDITQNQGKSLTQEKTLKDSQKKQNMLLEQKKKSEAQLVKLVTQNIAFSMIIARSAEVDSVDGVIEHYIYQP